ncbi:anti-sigma factor [Georgenia sp. SYP-B2076]|uniref:anti-sigma factor n=1 Tax=Georgenia sp. SYP-B2076 TaxID=2495881 RepID=UPI000F8F1001|nr:anti-sigma factor [Georgenia sp. SYP-B2076]
MSEHRAERELLGAWVLDAVDDVERVAVERAIRADPALAEEARALQETASLLAAASAVTPPAQVRDRVLAAVGDTAQQDGAGPGRQHHGQTPRAAGSSMVRRRGMWAAAAAVLLAAAIPGALAVQQAERAQRAEEQVTSLAEALARPDARVLRADVEGGGRAVAVVAGGAAVFTAQDLPPLADRHVYQLWVVDEDGPASAGVMTPTQGRVSADVSGLPAGGALAVTVEPAGGSAQPSSPPIVTLTTGA